MEITEQAILAIADAYEFVLDMEGTDCEEYALAYAEGVVAAAKG